MGTLIKRVSGIIYLYFKNVFDKVLHKYQMRNTSARVLGEDVLSGSQSLLSGEQWVWLSE